MPTPRHARTGAHPPTPHTPAGAHVRRLVFVFVLFWFSTFEIGPVYVVVLSFYCLVLSFLFFVLCFEFLVFNFDF